MSRTPFLETKPKSPPALSGETDNHTRVKRHTKSKLKNGGHRLGIIIDREATQALMALHGNNDGTTITELVERAIVLYHQYPMLYRPEENKVYLFKNGVEYEVPASPTHVLHQRLMGWFNQLKNTVSTHLFSK